MRRRVLIAGVGAAVVAPLGWLAAQAPVVRSPALTEDQQRAEALRAQTLALIGTLMGGPIAHEVELDIHLAHAEALTRALGESEVPEPSPNSDPPGTSAALRTALGRAATRFALSADSGQFAALFASIAASIAQIEAANR